MITTLKGDITGLDFDIIVNAANNHLLPGSGVCGAIFKKAGHQLETACQKIGYCQTGDAVMTKAYDLPSKAVIHTVGPIYHQDSNAAYSLKACYWNSMVLAFDYMRSHHLDSVSIAFPCIATGIYGYPHQEACSIAVNTIYQLMHEYPDAQKINVVFVCYQQEDYLLYKEELAKYAFYGR